jgi:hypothetical protein
MSWAARKGGATGNVWPQNSQQVRAGANPEYDPAISRGEIRADGEYCGAAAGRRRVRLGWWHRTRAPKKGKKKQIEAVDFVVPDLRDWVTNGGRSA